MASGDNSGANSPRSCSSEDFNGPVTRRRSGAVQRRRLRSAESVDDDSDSHLHRHALSSSDDDYEYNSDEDEDEDEDDEGEGEDSDPQAPYAEALLRVRPDQVLDGTGTMEHPVRFSTLQEARAVLDGLENSRFAVINNNSVTNVTFHEALVAWGSRPEEVSPHAATQVQRVRNHVGPVTNTHPAEKSRPSAQKKGDFSITKYADVMEWASPRMCLTHRTFFQHMRYSKKNDARRIARQPFEFQNELLVLDCFTDVLDNGEVSVGIIFTSRRLFRTVLRTLLGQSGSVLGVTDGTYKLHFGGWTLVSFGTFGVHYTAAHTYRQKFFFNGVHFGSLGHSASIANAFREVWPGIELLNCWPHLERKSRDKKALLSDGERYNDIIKPQLEYLSQARSRQQFEVLAKLVTQNWSDLGETEYAQWLDDEYLSEPWDLWNYSASGCPGIVPNQNPIESEPIWHHALGPVSAELLVTAVNMCAYANHYPTHRRKSRRAIANIQKYYFNAAYYEVRDDNLNGLQVSAARTKLYERSLQSQLRENEKVENIQLRYLSLHAVEIRERIPYDHNWNGATWSHEAIETITTKFRCGCKAFYQTGWLCAHVLACLRLVDGLDLSVMLGGLPARKPLGRPRKKSKCLVRDGVRRSQYSVDALIRRLVEKPASVINWSVLMVKTTTAADGEETERTYVAKIKPPFLRSGKRYWGVVYEDQDGVTPLAAEELARVINYSFQLGHNIVS